MKYLILILLFCSCQDEPIEPIVTPVVPIQTYQGYIYSECDNSAIYLNGVYHSNGSQHTIIETTLKQGDTIRMYGEAFAYTSRKCYVKLDNDFYFYYESYEGFDTTIIVQ
jgi:hypothetical protein